jgi:hypothetical protein
MSKMLLFASVSAVLAVGMILVGCSSQQPSQQESAPPGASQGEPAATGHEGPQHNANDHTGHEDAESGHAEHSGDAGHSEYADALAQLSAEDCALAEKQKTCPVSGEPLGSMGKPHKVTVEDREVLLCCSGCEAKIKENPKEYLAKLKP